MSAMRMMTLYYFSNENNGLYSYKNKFTLNKILSCVLLFMWCGLLVTDNNSKSNLFAIIIFIDVEIKIKQNGGERIVSFVFGAVIDVYATFSYNVISDS